jgi:hypothetical protein
VRHSLEVHIGGAIMECIRGLVTCSKVPSNVSRCTPIDKIQVVDQCKMSAAGNDDPAGYLSNLAILWE